MGTFNAKGFILGGISRRNSNLIRRLAAYRVCAISIFSTTAILIVVDDRDGAVGVRIYVHMI